MNQLPLHGEWVLVNPPRGPKVPFSQLELWFVSRFGFARRRRQACVIAGLVTLGEDRFGGSYQVGGQRGFFEATLHADLSLTIRFLGTVGTQCTAYPVTVRQRRRDVRRLALIAPLGGAWLGALLVNDRVYAFDGRGWRNAPLPPWAMRAWLAAMPLLVEELNWRAVDTDALLEALAGDSTLPALPRPERLRAEARRSGLVTRSYLVSDTPLPPGGPREVRSWDCAFVM